MELPQRIDRPKAPPVKCQGIKTRLVDFIASNVRWSGRGRWIEPFLGSGVVLFNLAPERALACDTNPHIIRLYQEIQSGEINGEVVTAYLTSAGEELAREGADYYYTVRSRFNETGGSLRFLFLNRSCFNGMMRFNGAGGYNVPFGKKPNRFRQAYVTKVANQVRWVADVLKRCEVEFRVADFRSAVAEATAEDFLYLDPPYPGRHNDYFNSWSDEDAEVLARLVKRSPAGYALSMWRGNQFRQNNHIEHHWRTAELRTTEHYYHLGSTERLRHPITEALLIRSEFAVRYHVPPRTCHDSTTSSS